MLPYSSLVENGREQQLVEIFFWGGGIKNLERLTVLKVLRKYLIKSGISISTNSLVDTNSGVICF